MVLHGTEDTSVRSSAAVEEHINMAVIKVQLAYLAGIVTSCMPKLMALYSWQWPVMAGDETNPCPYQTEAELSQKKNPTWPVNVTIRICFSQSKINRKI